MPLITREIRQQLSMPRKPREKFVYVTDQEGIKKARQALSYYTTIGFDLETTGLDPKRDKIRLISLSAGIDRITYVIDIFKSGLNEQYLWLQGLLNDHILVAHNALFDLQFLAWNGIRVESIVHDTMLMSQLLTAGTEEGNSLEEVSKRWLNKKLEKVYQKSDWSGELTKEQLAYAAEDSQVLAVLAELLKFRCHDVGLGYVLDLETACLPAVVQMSLNGVRVDQEGWLGEVEGFKNKAAEYKTQLQEYGEINWNSPKQVKECFLKHGLNVTSTGHKILAELAHPMSKALDSYRSNSKRVSTYGPKWMKFLYGDRVYANWRQIGTASGRMSCTKPNLQQIPRDSFRRHIIASPEHVLIKGDYSQIEIRLAASIAQDQVLIQSFKNKEDLYTEGAKRLLGVKEVTKHDRQISKSLHLGLLYGMGVKRLIEYTKTNFGITLSYNQARDFRNKFFNTYRGLARWHDDTRAKKATESRTLLNRRRLFDEGTPDTERLNTPVQGSGADGLKRAFTTLNRKHLVRPVLAVHDELVIEYPEAFADEGAAILKEEMINAMQPLISDVPVEAEVSYAKNWAK